MRLPSPLRPELLRNRREPGSKDKLLRLRFVRLALEDIRLAGGGIAQKEDRLDIIRPGAVDPQ